MTTEETVRRALPLAIAAVDIPDLGPVHRGKVRDAYVVGSSASAVDSAASRERVIITTDRISAFDQVLGLIPYRGQVLNQISAFWFKATEDILANHMISLPDPNVMRVREARPLPIEVIVRAFITGVTSTSLWTLYKRGVDKPYGLELPAGLKKNARLPQPVITPTTKATGGAHDERLTAAQVTACGYLKPALWAQVRASALALFERGQQVAASRGVMLVDTKYEFGLIKGADGEEVLILIDELHTPDSSRYWLADSYEAALEAEVEPEHFDKEHLRKWLKSQGYSGEEPFAGIPEDVVVELSLHYIAVYERLTGAAFVPAAQPGLSRIINALCGPFTVGE